MKVVFDLLHPAHVHVFRHARELLLERGHEVVVYSRRKDVTVELLDAHGIPHEVLSTQRPGALALAGEMGLRCARLLRRLWQQPPDVMLGIMGPAIAVVGRLFPGCRTLVFYDNESATSVNRAVYRLADQYITPQAYMEKAGPNHRRYAGYHELAYLHPRYFKPDSSVVERYGLADRPLYVLRFVAWESVHDFGETGLSPVLKSELVQRLSQRGRVVISSESPLPEAFEPYRLRIDPADIHHVLAHASLLIGESSTMASEAAILGTHAFFISKTGRGVNDEQEQRYGLVHCFDHQQDEAVLSRLDALIALEDLDADAHQRQQRLLAETVDLTALIVDLVEGRATQATVAS